MHCYARCLVGGAPDYVKSSQVVFACFLVAPSIFFSKCGLRTLRFDIVVISVVINAFRFYRRLYGMVLRLSVLVVCV